LAYEAYTHFTSPIRRYPDLLVHRVIKAILAKKTYTLPALPLPGEAHAKLSRRLAVQQASKENKKPKKTSPNLLAWEAAGLHCSANERRGDEASRDVESWLKCQYMREHLGEEFGGVVSSATNFGLFVTLDAMYVEGLIHITELGSEYFRFDEARQELRGERSGIRYAIGSRVRVQVSRVDLDGRKIDFRLVNDEEPSTHSSRSSSGSGAIDCESKSSSKKKKATARDDIRSGDKNNSSIRGKSPLTQLTAQVKKAVAKKLKSRKSRR